MTDLLTGNFLDELRAEYAHTVSPLAATPGSSLDPPPLPGVAAIPSSTPAAGEQPSHCPLPAVGVDSYMEISA